MKDSFNRPVDYLRISVTDRCNLRCLYCMPEDGVSRLSHFDVLRYEEIGRIVRAAAGLGISKIRITGGEPLVRPGIADLVRMINAVNGITDISLTTNAMTLASQAEELASAGLRRVNISLDTLIPESFTAMTRGGQIEKVFSGIEAAKSAGLGPVKINSVIIRGFNEHEIIPLSEWAFENSLHLRFIEFMPVNDHSLTFEQKYISSDEIKTIIFTEYPETEPFGITGGGPAENWRVEGRQGSLGIIEAVSHSFCSSCNRIRLTADGKLKPCLFSNDEINLLPSLRRGSPDSSRLEALIAEAVMMKPLSHGDFRRVNSSSRCMNEIGG